MFLLAKGIEGTVRTVAGGTVFNIRVKVAPFTPQDVVSGGHAIGPIVMVTVELTLIAVIRAKAKLLCRSVAACLN